MEYNLKKVLKNLFINLIITFVIAFIINYFGINSDKHGWFANIIDKINFIHILVINCECCSNCRFSYNNF